MKIYIVGSVASGKTTLAKEISNKTGIPCTHLDGLVHIKDRNDKIWGNRRRPDEEIKQLFTSEIMKSHWIIEDAGRRMFSEGMELADVIVHLKPSIYIRRIRVITRFIKQKLGIEESIYTPNIRMLKFLIKALKAYETGEDDLKSRLNNYADKVVTIRSKKEIKKFVESLEGAAS